MRRELFREVGRRRGCASHLSNRIAVAALQQGDIERAARSLRRRWSAPDERGDRRDEAIALERPRQRRARAGELDEGVRLMYESAALAEEVGFDWWRGVTLGNLADWLVEAGELDEAERALVRGSRGARWRARRSA